VISHETENDVIVTMDKRTYLQNTRRRQTKQKAQHRNLKRWATPTPPKTVGEPRCFRKVSSSCLL